MAVEMLSSELTKPYAMQGISEYRLRTHDQIQAMFATMYIEEENGIDHDQAEARSNIQRGPGLKPLSDN